VKKSIYLIISSLFLSFFLLTGCVTNTTKTNFGKGSDISSPIPIIDGPTEAYFGEDIEFDASASYDSNGIITQFLWNFGDGTKIQGQKVNHKFEFLGEYSIKYPLIYTVSLIVKDDDGNNVARTHYIKLFPRKYSFYLTTGRATSVKPMAFKEPLGLEKVSKMGLSPYLEYEFEETICLSTCSWNAELYLEKPLFSIISRVKLSFIDSDGKEIFSKEQKLGFNMLWKTKNIHLSGKFSEDLEISKIRISIPSFSLTNNVYMLYGAEKPSSISFDF